MQILLTIIAQGMNSKVAQFPKLLFKNQHRMLQMVSFLEKEIQLFQQSLKIHYSKINIEIQTFCQIVCPQYFNSKIADKQNQQLLLFKQLKSVVDLHSLQQFYRASQNNFYINLFKDKCHQKSNLLILVKNERGKKYGAFTPCTLKKSSNTPYEQDRSMKSFVFTFSGQNVSKLMKKQFAIKNVKTDYLILFGQNTSCCMAISENANTQKKNFFYPRQAYQQNSIFNQYQYVNTSNLKGSYKLAQYQVYQVKQNPIEK